MRTLGRITAARRVEAWLHRWDSYQSTRDAEWTADRHIADAVRGALLLLVRGRGGSGRDALRRALDQKAPGVFDDAVLDRMLASPPRPFNLVDAWRTGPR